MQFIEYDKNRCDECYKCLRVCPTKAIAITSSRREIVDEMCIKCGLCRVSCPTDALQIKNDRMLVKEALKDGRKVVVSLAPSFVSAFIDVAPLSLVTGLRKLGFSVVEETAIAAEIVSNDYQAAISNDLQSNYITSCCPSSTYLIEQYYPDLIDLMIPIVSPMIAHGRMLKEKYGEDCFVTFIGPCLAKKAEAEDPEVAGVIDAVISFNELNDWFNEQNICIKNLELGEFDRQSTKRGSAYPLGSSLWNPSIDQRIHINKKFIRVEGIERCNDILDTLREGKLSNYCIEMNICNGSCINGPDFPDKSIKFYEKENMLNTYVNEKPVYIKPLKNSDKKPINTKRLFNPKPVSIKKPNELELKKLLASIGKYSDADYLNCGACGYRSCNAKAKAALLGLTDIHMCMPYLRSKAESFQSVIFEHSPNLICILDDNLNIQDVNPAFEKVFNDRFVQMKGKSIHIFMDDNLFTEVINTEENVIARKVAFNAIQKNFLVNIVYLQEEHVIVAIFTDITLSEKNRQELLRVKEQTISACQEVIEKQMRAAQEIASLLGETTAETKVNLNRLKDIVLFDDGGVS